MEALGAFVLLGIIVVAVVLAGLAIFMPLFVYQIRNHSDATLREIRALNDNIGRFLASVGQPPPSSSDTRPKPSQQALKPAIPQPHFANLDDAAKFFGVSAADRRTIPGTTDPTGKD